MNPVCKPCKTEMVCDANGSTVASEGYPNHVYAGDEFSCPSCGNVIIVGFGQPSHREVEANTLLPSA
jgi:predicted RNA-binding Zn-ribbon protein involved in translation (DUF1610 family)